MNSKPFYHFFFHILVLTIFLFLALSKKENGDMNVVVFGTFLYLPYILILTVLNLLLIEVGLKWITKKPFVWLTTIFTNIVLTIWIMLNCGQITIRYWTLTLSEFVILNIVILTLNVLTLIWLTRKQKSEIN
jgi:hypothetical protein